jgi:mRNA interferase MazF
MAEVRRGEVWIVDLGYVAKLRPCLVVSVETGSSERDLLTLVPHTTTPRKSRFETALAVRFLREGAFDSQSLITVPRGKLTRRLDVLPPEQIRQIDRLLARWLGLPGVTPWRGLPDGAAEPESSKGNMRACLQ